MDSRQALWNSLILGECLREAGTDVGAGLAAAQLILSTQPIPASFSVDAGGREHRGKGPGGGQFTAKRADAAAKASKWLEKAKKFPAAVVARAVDKAKSLYAKLEEKYGPRWAKAILAVGIVTFPTPFTTGAVLATCGIAKLSQKLLGKGGAAMAVEDLSEADLRRLGREFIESVIAEVEKWDVESTDLATGDGSHGSLDRALGEAEQLAKDAKRDFRKGKPGGLHAFADKYRLRLAKLLTSVQLSSLLNGMLEIASMVPAVAAFSGAAAPPPTLDPEDAKAVVDRVVGLSGAERTAALFDLPEDQWTYIEQAVVAKEASAEWGLEEPDDFGIDAALRQLSARGALSPGAYRHMAEAARTKAVTVAGVEAQNTLDKVLKVDATLGEEVLDAVGKGTFMSPSHLEAIIRANARSAFSDGQMTVLRLPTVRSAFPYCGYNATHDDAVRDEHLALEKLGIDGTNVYRTDDPVFQLFRPPWDWGDRCGWTSMTVKQAAEAGVKEAQQWLESGIEPYPPAYVPMPDFQPPDDFKRDFALSLQPLWVALAVEHAPPGGITIQGVFYKGGEFIPAEVVAKATPEEKEKLKRGHDVGANVKVKGESGYKVTQHYPLHGAYRVVHSSGVRKVVPALHLEAEAEQPKAEQPKAEQPKAEQPKADGRIAEGASVTYRGQPGWKVLKHHSNGKDYVLQNAETGVKRPAAASTVKEVEGERGAVDEAPGETGGGVAETSGGKPGAEPASQPAGEGASSGVPAASVEEVNRRLDRYRNFFQTKGQHKVVEWLDKLRDHINSTSTDAAVAALGEEVRKADRKVQYAGHVLDDHPDAAFIEAYLKRAGISLLPDNAKPTPGMQMVASKAGVLHSRKADVVPPTPHERLTNKLNEARYLPGLGASEDLSKLIGGKHGAKVQRFTPEILAKLDATYGKSGWVVKSYGEEAFAGYGVFFPQRIQQLHDDARNLIWNGGAELAKYGFEFMREPLSNNTFEEALAGRAPTVDDAQFRVGNNVGGLEQDVYYDEKNDKYIKIAKTPAGQNKTQQEFLERHAAMNAVWPELGYKLEGFTPAGLPVVSMNSVGVATPSAQEVDNWLRENDWTPVGEGWKQGTYEAEKGPDVWYNAKYNMTISDTHVGNWRKSSTGKLLPIDINVKAKNVNKLPKHTGDTITGIRHADGNVYRSGSAKYDKLYGDVRTAADKVVQDRLVWDPSNNKHINVGSPAANEAGTLLPSGRYMAQPAFPVVGVSDAERAQGVTFKKAGEGRVHVFTRDGKAEIIPHATWLKNEHLPVVFESDETLAMAQAAVDAINAMPLAARRGQLYAPDVVKTADGYRVVEANPTDRAGASGYLQDNPMVMDAYVSHVVGREPAHVKFVRNLLKKHGAAMSTDAHGREHRGEGPGGGQFVKKGSFTGTSFDDETGEYEFYLGGSKVSEAEYERERGLKAKHSTQVTEVRRTDERAFSGDPVKLRTKLSKQQTGKLGEAVAVAYLRMLGKEDAALMNANNPSFPVDVIEDSAPTEVKTGLASNSRGAQQWRLTFSMEKDAERAWYEHATDAEKAAWNKYKLEAVRKRKEAVIAELEEELGVKLKPRTLGVILHPDKKLADIYEFDGFHDRIGWNSEQAEAAYRGTVVYG